VSFTRRDHRRVSLSGLPPLFGPLLIFYSVNITASQSPSLVDPVERLNHAEGTNATLTCSVGSGDLNGLTFEWFKDERKLAPSSKYKIVVLPDNVNSILRVIDLKPDDSAVYSCVARNRFGQDRISTRLTVKGECTTDASDVLKHNAHNHN
jgi:hypothetical protein